MVGVRCPGGVCHASRVKGQGRSGVDADPGHRTSPGRPPGRPPQGGHAKCPPNRSRRRVAGRGWARPFWRSLSVDHNGRKHGPGVPGGRSSLQPATGDAHNRYRMGISLRSPPDTQLIEHYPTHTHTHKTHIRRAAAIVDYVARRVVGRTGYCRDAFGAIALCG